MSSVTDFPPSEPRFLRWEGGYIEVTGDRQAAVDWYRHHLGFDLIFDDGLQTVLRFPGGNGLPLVSAQVPASFERQRQGRVRFCLECPDVRTVHTLLRAEGVPVEPVQPGPDGSLSFDAYDLEGTRLTLVEAPHWREQYPQARVVRYAPPRFPVRDLKPALQWYQEHLKAAVLEQYPEQQAALLVVNGRTPFWLEAREDINSLKSGPQFARYFLGTLEYLLHPGFAVPLL